MFHAFNIHVNACIIFPFNFSLNKKATIQHTIQKKNRKMIHDTFYQLTTMTVMAELIDNHYLIIVI